MPRPLLTIIVNSTDSYADCWDPFFTLLKHFWPDCPYPIVLNTETRDYAFPGLDVRAARIASSGPAADLPWSESVLRCLAGIETDYILWTLEDLFLTGPVNGPHVAHLLALMAAKDITHINLTPRSSDSAYLPSSEAGLWAIAQDHKYRISLLKGLWNRKRFMAYMRPHENPWQLELFGSRRANQTPDSFFCVQTQDRFDPQTWPIPYLVTGITKGRWNPEVVPLFREHQITMEFSRRGFYREPPALIRKALTAWKLVQNLTGLASSLRRPQT